MFKFFKDKNVKEDNKKEDDTLIASVSYVVKRNSNGPLIDIELNDYNDESIGALCLILDILGNDMSYIDTINMIKECFLRENRHDLLVKVFSKINPNIKSKILNIRKDKVKDEPYIKPSEMFKQQ